MPGVGLAGQGRPEVGVEVLFGDAALAVGAVEESEAGVAV